MRSSHLVIILSIALLLGSGLGIACILLTDSEDVSAATGSVSPSITYGGASMTSSTSNSKTYTITPQTGFKVPESSGFSYSTSSAYVSATYTPSSDRSSATVTITWSSGSASVSFTVKCVSVVTPSITNGSASMTSKTSSSQTFTITPNTGYQVPDKSKFNCTPPSNVTVTYTPNSSKSSASVVVTWTSGSAAVNFSLACEVKQYANVTLVSGTYELQSITSSSETYKITADSTYVVPGADEVTLVTDTKYTVTYQPSADRKTATLTVNWSSSKSTVYQRIDCYQPYTVQYKVTTKSGLNIAPYTHDDFIFKLNDNTYVTFNLEKLPSGYYYVVKVGDKTLSSNGDEEYEISNSILRNGLSSGGNVGKTTVDVEIVELVEDKTMITELNIFAIVSVIMPVLLLIWTRR